MYEKIVLFHNCLLFSLYYLLLRLGTVLFVVTIVFDEVRPKVSCIHTKVIIVCHTLRVVKKRLLVVFYLSCLLQEQRQ